MLTNGAPEPCSSKLRIGRPSFGTPSHARDAGSGGLSGNVNCAGDGNTVPASASACVRSPVDHAKTKSQSGCRGGHRLGQPVLLLRTGIRKNLIERAGVQVAGSDRVSHGSPPATAPATCRC